MAFFKTSVSVSRPTEMLLDVPKPGSSRRFTVDGKEVLQFWDGTEWVDEKDPKHEKAESWQKG